MEDHARGAAAPVTRPSAARASAWSALDIVIRQSVTFVVTVILARLLTPEDFGVVALLTFFTSLSIVFVQGGLSVALIQRQQTSRDEESAIFWWNLFGSAILGAALVAAGPAIAAFFENPVLGPLTVAAAAQIILSAAGSVPTALLTRQLRFDLLAKAGAVASVAAGILGVTAALLGAGVWALALHMAALALFNTAALWIVCDWRPLPHFAFATIRSLFGFGAWVGVGSFLDVLYTHGFALLIGKLHGVRELGFYNRAAATQTLPGSVLSSIIGRVTLPLFSAKQDDREALRRGLRLAIGAVMLLNLPMMAGLVLLSDLVVIVLFGERWLPAAPILSILAVGGILLPLHIINLQLILARGQSATFVRNELAKKAIGAACVIVGSLFGITGLAVSQVVYSVLAFFVNALPARRSICYGALHQLRDLGGLFVAMLAMSAAVYLVKTGLPLPPLASLLACTAAGAVVYGLTGWIAGFRGFREPAELLIREFVRRPAADLPPENAS